MGDQAGLFLVDLKDAGDENSILHGDIHGCLSGLGGKRIWWPRKRAFEEMMEDAACRHRPWDQAPLNKWLRSTVSRVQ